MAKNSNKAAAAATQTGDLVKVIMHYGGQVADVTSEEAETMVARGLAHLASPVALAIAGEDVAGGETTSGGDTQLGADTGGETVTGDETAAGDDTQSGADALAGGDSLTGAA